MNSQNVMFLPLKMVILNFFSETAIENCHEILIYKNVLRIMKNE